MPTTAYQKLTQKFERLFHINHLMAIASWDEAVNMPDGGSQARAKAFAEGEAILKEILLSSEIKELLHQAEDEQKQLNTWEKANLRQMKRQWTLNHCVDPELSKKRTLANMECQQVWRTLRAQNNWDDFKPYFQKVVDYAKEEAKQRAQVLKVSPYDSLIDLFEPGGSQVAINKIFADLKTFLPAVLKEITERQNKESFVAPTGQFPTEKQKNLGLELMRAVGFDFNNGRLDVSHHPFCGGVPHDVRITTRYNEKDFMSALMGVLHETGHACYEQNLPPDWVHQPVGAPLSMASHEGQSLFFEMQMSRSFPFFKFSAAIMKKHLFDCCPDEKFWTAQNLYKLNTRVQPGFIRVDADEVTYPGHIILRYEIERDLISGTLNIDDIPHVWDEKMREYLGLSTKNDFKNGCMQDVHWPSGAFGYFPSYTMGAMFAAQMAQAMEKENPQMWTEIERGDFSKVRGWLKNKIWSLGSFYSLDDLLSQATGSTLSAEPFKNHIRKRYLG